MRKMNIATVGIVAIVTTSLILAACSNAAGGESVAAYDLKFAPKAISVDVPTSLVKPAAAPAARSLASSRDIGGGGHSFFNNENRGAYHWIKESMWQAQKRLARAASKLVLVDSVIAANGLSPAAVGSPPTHQAKTLDHVWTDAEIAAIASLLPASFATNPGFDAEAKLPKAGDTAKLPAFDYSAVDPTDAVNGSYAFKVSFAAQQSEDDSAATVQETNNFYWTADKGGFKYSHEKDDVSNPASPVVLEMNFVAYDGSTSSLAAGRQAREGSMSLQVKADPASTASGVFIAFSSSIQADKAEDYQSDWSVNAAGTTFAISAEGYADDAGGYVDETLVLTAGGATSTFYFKESFDAAGRLTLAQVSADSTFATLTDIAGVQGEDHSAPAADGHAYDGKKAEVKIEHHSMDTQGPGQEVQKEERHHAGEMQGSGMELEFAPTAGQTYASGDSWGVSDSAGDFTGAHILGTGTIVEPGQLRVVFSSKPAEGLTQLFISKLLATGGADPASEVLTIDFHR
jgi:hypothetical protein